MGPPLQKLNHLFDRILVLHYPGPQAGVSLPQKKRRP